MAETFLLWYNFFETWCEARRASGSEWAVLTAGSDSSILLIFERLSEPDDFALMEKKEFQFLL